jgi:nicotinate-nucleotide adenylyltransferase
LISEKIGLFGGSFDPIHDGHILPILEAKRSFGLDRVVYLPTAQPPHKKRRRFAPALSRYAMVELALLPYPELKVSGYELLSDSYSYTVETLEHFRSLDDSADLHLMIGADSFYELPGWRRWRDILQLAKLVVLARPGWKDLDQAPPEDLAVELRQLPEDRLLWLETERVDQSSTRVRELLRAGKKPDRVPAAVLDFCRKYELYA